MSRTLPPKAPWPVSWAAALRPGVLCIMRTLRRVPGQALGGVQKSRAGWFACLKYCQVYPVGGPGGARWKQGGHGGSGAPGLLRVPRPVW